MTKVTLYGKPGCCLCDDARAEVAAAREGRADLDYAEVDITLDPALHREYGERIPVVEVDGNPAFELHVDRAELAQLLDTVRE